MTEPAAARSGHGEKAETIGTILEKFKAAKMALVTEYRGLTVAQMTRLRREIRLASGEYQVIKNTLARRAMKDTAYRSLDALLEGPNGWVFGYEDPISLAKALIKFVEEYEKLRIKGAVIEGQFMDQAQVKLLARMPSRLELQAKLLALMQAPATQLVRLIQEPAARMVRLLESLRRQKEGS